MRGSINRSIGTASGAVEVMVGLRGFIVLSGHAAAGHEGGVLLSAIGPFIGGEHTLNILALDGADNVLHAGSALLLIGVGVGADRRARDRELAGV